MAASGEKDKRAEKDLRDETVALPPEGLPDPDATVAAPADELPGAADGATRRIDAAPTHVLADDLPTIVVPQDETATVTAPDGLDAMDDPYYAPVAAEDLTVANVPVSIPSPVQSLPERRRRLPRWAIALIVAVLLAVGCGVAYYTYEQELWGGKTVPVVVGMTQEDATSALEELGFVVSVEGVVTDEAPGTVLASDPVSGVRADPAAGIVLSVATERVIPEVVGLTEEEARQALIDVGAQSIQTVSEGSSAPAGTVISVTPGEGEPFVASDQVTLVVARSFTVPDVLGMELVDAQALLAESGLSGTVAYVDSAHDAGTVVETSPSVGSEVAEGATVELRVAATYPDDPYDLLPYLDLVPEALVTYLEQEGFELEYGEIFAATGNAHAAYSGARGDLLQISDYPETGFYAGGSQTDVISQGAGVGGVRYAFSADTLPEGGSSVSEEGLRAVMRACGFDGLLDSCTQEDIVIPEQGEAAGEGAAEEGAAEEGEDLEAGADQGPSFICGYGREGDNVWAVIIGGSGDGTRVIALAAPAGHFDGIDLSPYGDSICDYIAYTDLYAK